MAGTALPLFAQGRSSGQGTNYEPPSTVEPQALVKEQPPPPEEPNPYLQLPPVDWGARETWVKLALLVGSVLLARRAFTDMTD